MPSYLIAGDSSNGVQVTSSNDNALTIQTGAAGAKVNAIALASDGTATLLKGPTITSGSTTFGTAPMPIPSGTAPVYGCRAWVKFAGGSGALSASGNVTSVTRTSTGTYTVNFTTAMPSSTYSQILTVEASGTYAATVTGASSTTASSTILVFNTSTGVAFDPPAVHAMFIC